MKNLHYLVILLSILSSCTSREFFVSPGGSDQNPGSKSKPFLTIQKAQEVVREKLAEGSSGNISVWLADGSYFISEPLKFDDTDSGNGEKVVSYKAVKGTKPVISGGKEVTEWQHRGNGLWAVSVGMEMAGFRELFVDGQRATRARYPNNDYLRVAEVGADRRTNFRFHEGDFPHPHNPQHVELVLLHDWSITRIPLAEIDYQQSRITAIDSIGAKSLNFFNLDNWEKDPKYFLENDMAFLDSPGEWFFDRDERLLYLILPAGADPEQMKVTIPVAGPHLLVIEGSEQQKVRNINFEGISFEHCSWQLPVQTYAGIQACHFDSRPSSDSWSVVPAAVYAEWAENVTIRNCRFSKLGGSGIWFSTGSKNCSVADSHFEDISGNAIMIGEGRDRKVNGEVWWKAVPEQSASSNLVSGNTITDCGKQFYGAVGIWCGFIFSTKISNNNLYNLPYTGISVGWEWSPVPTPCRDNHITDNHIHHIMQVLSDGGGIYMLGLQPGSTITGNLIHDVSLNAGRAESNGMFLDEGTTDVTVAGNIIYNIAKSPLRFHRATTNLVKENVLSCADDVPPVRYNATREEDIRLENNLILKDSDTNDWKLLDEAIAKWQNRNIISAKN
jgi:hypothetical protein